jgi:hypothetical protein
MTANVNQPSPPMLFGPVTITATTAIGVPVTNASGIQCQDIDYVCVQFGAGLVGTVAFEQSNDNINWVSAVLIDPSINTAGSSTGSTNPGAKMFVGTIPGKYFRVRCSAYTSGSCSIMFAAYEGALPLVSQNIAAAVPANASPTASVAGGYTYNHITTATTTVVKASAGYLRGIFVGTGVANATITIDDQTSAAAPTVSVITLPAAVGAPVWIPLDLNMLNGITVVTSGATDLTVVYK